MTRLFFSLEWALEIFTAPLTFCACVCALRDSIAAHKNFTIKRASHRKSFVDKEELHALFNDNYLHLTAKRMGGDKLKRS